MNPLITTLILITFLTSCTDGGGSGSGNYTYSPNISQSYTVSGSGSSTVSVAYTVTNNSHDNYSKSDSGLGWWCQVRMYDSGNNLVWKDPADVIGPITYITMNTGTSRTYNYVWDGTNTGDMAIHTGVYRIEIYDIFSGSTSATSATISSVIN